jgi:hypothetical protein
MEVINKIHLCNNNLLQWERMAQLGQVQMDRIILEVLELEELSQTKEIKN